MCLCIFRKTSILTPRTSFFFFGFLSLCYGAKSGGRGRIFSAFLRVPWRVYNHSPTRPPPQQQGFRPFLGQNQENTSRFCTFRKTSILTPRISFFFFGFLSLCYGRGDAAGSTTLTRNRPRHFNLGITHKNFMKRALFILSRLGRESCCMPIATLSLDSHSPLLSMDRAVVVSYFANRSVISSVKEYGDWSKQTNASFSIVL